MKLVVSKSATQEIKDDVFFKDVSDENIDKMAKILEAFRRVTKPTKYSRPKDRKTDSPLVLMDGILYASVPKDAKVLEFKK